jgi:hypothetical protein
MDSNWAVEHLQVIRTLMERSAVYRRAMAPIMTFNGAVGLVAAGVGWGMKAGGPRSFLIYWACVCGVALVGSFLLVRRQALKEAEPFWSPPTRRVTQAFLPPFFAAAAITIIAFLQLDSAPNHLDVIVAMWWLPLSWVVLYGCALHSAGCVMPRGMRVFGWIFVLCGSGLFALGIPDWTVPMNCGYGIMGFFFGGLHLAAGAYLYVTEKRGNEL